MICFPDTEVDINTMSFFMLLIGKTIVILGLNAIKLLTDKLLVILGNLFGPV